MTNIIISLQYFTENAIQLKKSGKNGIQIGKGEIRLLFKDDMVSM